MSESNTSATGGFIRLSPAPGQTDTEDVLHDLIVGITGFCGELVRPRWQPEPPKEPKPDVDWCAFGITRYEPHNFPAIQHHGEGEGSDEITAHEILTVLASIYGPGHMNFARLLRLGLHVPRNLKVLRENKMAFTRAGSIVPVPALVAMQWRARADITLTFQLMTRQRFDSPNIQEISGTLVSDHPKNDDGKPGISVSLGCQACPHACWREA